MGPSSNSSRREAAPARATLCLIVAVAIAAPAVAGGKPPRFAPAGSADIRQVVDGETIVLADGRTLRLAEIDMPDAGRRGERELAARAKTALDHLVAGGKVELRLSGAGTDRHGRVVAQLYAGRHWIQRELVRRGLARVHGSADDRLGVVALLAAEAQARSARRGLWRQVRFAVRRAEDAAADAGSFQLDEGTVVDVAAVPSGVYVRFGQDGGSALSLHIGGAALKLCRVAGLDPSSLKGARVRVRGFIDGDRRPLMEVSFPEQIELL